MKVYDRERVKRSTAQEVEEDVLVWDGHTCPVCGERFDPRCIGDNPC